MKKLSYSTPIIDTYSGVAGNVAVLMTNEKNIPLIVSNHFMLCYYDVLKAPGFNWAYYNDDFKNVYTMDAEIRKGHLLYGIKKAIDEGFYVQIYIDHYYIEGASSFRKEHMLHDFATIFGYDDNRKMFLVADNFENGKYCVIEIKYEQLLDARCDNDKLPIEKFMIRSDYEYCMDLSELYTLLTCYIEGKVYYNTGKLNSNNKHLLNGGVTYGISYYDVLNDKLNENQFDPRPFHILINHMEIYKLIVYVLEKNNALYNKKQYINKIENLVKETVMLRNLYLKYSLSHSEKVKNNLMKTISQIREEEKSVITFLLEELDN